MHKAIIISGLLTHLSDNIIPFLDDKTDIYCYTWDIEDNSRWIKKLNRYKKYCKDVYVQVNKPLFHSKRHSYFYSTYKAVNMIKNIFNYDRIIKFKPNVVGNIKYKGKLEHYFKKASLQSRPLLSETTKEECLYGSIYYKTMDERMFSGYPLAFSKIFHILEDSFVHRMNFMDLDVRKQYGKDCEGSIFWKEWINSYNIKLIQDIDLIIPDSKPWQQ